MAMSGGKADAQILAGQGTLSTALLCTASARVDTSPTGGS
jgi:hypothetical protein